MKRELYTKIPPKSMVRAYKEKAPSQLPKGRKKEGTPFFTFNFSLLPSIEGGVGGGSLYFSKTFLLLPSE